MVNFSVLSQINEDTFRIIEQKYGEQWKFCTCIQKIDSVNTALMEANDAEFDVLLKRSEYIDRKCKWLLIIMYDKTTPEEREAHSEKVKDCLREEE